MFFLNLKNGGGHRLVAFLAVFLANSLSIQAQGDNFFQNTNTEVYAYVSVANRNLGDFEGPDWFQYFTQETSNYVGSAYCDEWLTHISTTSRANYGFLALTVSADSKGNIHVPECGCYDFYQGHSYHPAAAAWADYVTINNSLLNGQSGYLRINMSISGNLQNASGGSAGGSASMGWTFKLGNNYRQFLMSGQYAAFNEVLNTSVNIDAMTIAASNSLQYLDIPIVFGQASRVFCYLSLYADSASGLIDVSANQAGYLQVQWLGAKVLDVNSNEITSYTLISESGTVWTNQQNNLPGNLKFSAIDVVNNTNLAFSGSGGITSNLVYLVTSQNLDLPLINWVYLDTNRFDTVGHVFFTNTVSSIEPKRFYRLVEP